MEIINAVGKPCPIPVIEAKKALREAAAGEMVRVLVDNSVSCQNLEKMARGMGLPVSHEEQSGGNILVAITAAAPAADIAAAGGLAVAIGQNTMGAGSDDLGAVLIKAFIYSLAEMDTPPETLLFFNSGVKLAVEGSAALADLKTLEAKGTAIASCGTCLDFYQLKEKLAVGAVTNMYAIAQTMSSAARLINL